MRVSDLSPASVEPLLQGRLGRPYRFVEECTSTQRLLDGSVDEGATVATDLQTQGRGRLGRIWEAPAGRALLFSVLLHPSPPTALWPELCLVAGDPGGGDPAGGEHGKSRARDWGQRQPDGQGAACRDSQAADLAPCRDRARMASSVTPGCDPARA